MKENVRGRLVTGVIGSDTHIVGNLILGRALENEGYKVASLGALTPAEEFVETAVKSEADAILVSSLYGQGELDCAGFRERCQEAGIGDILIYIGGYLVVGDRPWEETEATYKSMGFDRVFPPGTLPADVFGLLAVDIEHRRASKPRASE